jgi:hypothetical protein
MINWDGAPSAWNTRSLFFVVGCSLLAVEECYKENNDKLSIPIQALFPKQELFAHSTSNIRKDNLFCSCNTPRAQSRIFATSSRIVFQFWSPHGPFSSSLCCRELKYHAFRMAPIGARKWNPIRNWARGKCVLAKATCRNFITVMHGQTICLTQKDKTRTKTRYYHIIQDDSEGNFSILGNDSMDHCEKEFIWARV